MKHRFLSAIVSRLIAGTLCILLAVGDTAAAASLRPSPRPGPQPAAVIVPPLVETRLLSSPLRGLLAGTGSYRETSTASQPLLILVQDIHGHPVAQKNIESAIGRLLSADHAGAVLLEGLAGDLDVPLLRRLPDPELRDVAVASLLEQKRISGAAAALVTSEGRAPIARGLEDGFLYRSNVDAVKPALATSGAFEKEASALAGRIDRLKKKYFSADLYLTDLAVSRYEDGRMPLTSLLTLLRHRGATLSAAMQTILRVETLERLYDAGAVGDDVRNLVSRLRGRLSPTESALLFDAAFRHQKGRLDTDEFVSILDQLCRSHGIDLSEFPGLRIHLERALAAKSVSPDDLFAAVERLRPAVLNPLAASGAERDLLALDRRARLLRKLSRLQVTASEWAELTHRPEAPAEPEIALAFASLEKLDDAVSAARDFYRLAEKRNAEFERNITDASAAAGPKPLIVVAGGYHADAIVRAAARVGRGVGIFTPATGDLRGWDAASPLQELARSLDGWDGAADARVQTLAPRPMPVSTHARLAAAAIARGSLNRRDDLVQWGRDVLGYGRLSLDGVNVRRTGDRAVVDVTVGFENQRTVFSVTFGRGQLAIIAVEGFVSRTLGLLIRRLVRFYHSIRGVTIRGVGLHTGEPAWIRVVPREPGNGINFIRADQPGSLALRTIPVGLNFVRRNRRRFTGLENRGLRVTMVEHLLFAMRTNNIWDADIYVGGEELPILDGSARLYIDALKPLANWSPPRRKFRLKEPVVFRRDDKTAVLFLPLRENETNSVFYFAGDWGAVQNGPVEAKFEFDSRNLGRAQAELGSHPTFVERPVEELRRLGFFRGGEAYRPGELESPDRSRLRRPMPSFVDVSDPANWRNGNIDRRRLAMHKVMDLVGDMELLRVSLNADVECCVVALATGHRDTAEIMTMVESGTRFPFGYNEIVGTNLAGLLAANRISPELHAEIIERLAPFKGYDESLASEPGTPHGGISPEVIERLRTNLVWVGDGPNPVDLTGRLSDYLFESGGSALKVVAGHVATAQFPPEQVSRILVRLSEKTAREAIFEVAFVREGMLSHEWPRVAIIVSLSPGDDSVSRIHFNMKQAATANELRREMPTTEGRAADRTLDHFPRIGLYKYGVFASQWLSEQYATFAPVLTKGRIDQENGSLEFDAFWKQAGGEPERQMMSEERRAEVARAAAEMLTNGYLRILRKAPLAAAPMNGQLIENIDFERDFMYDIVDKKAGLNLIRGLRAVGVEQFLYHVFHMKLTETPESHPKIPTVAGRRVRMEWEPFALQTAAMLDGIQAALERTFGPEPGKAAAAAWFRRYVEYIDRPERGPLVNKGDVNQTWRFRLIRIETTGTSGETVSLPYENSVEAIFGQEIRPLLQEKIARLEGEVNRGEVFAAARWIARITSRLLSIGIEDAVRLAAYTEGVVFSAVSYVAMVFIQQAGYQQTGQSVALAAGLGWLAWMASHRWVLAGGRSRFRWESIARVGWLLKARITVLGVLVVVLPVVAHAVGGFPLFAQMTIIAGLIHYLANPAPTGSGWIAGSERLLDRRQDARRNLDSQA